jgi:predicted RNase H-like HicB family nuclease
MERKFTLEYSIDDNWYVGRIKEVPGVFSQGETLEELEENIADAYRMVISEESGYTPSGDIRQKEMTLKV